nr:beta-xylosidase [uncultured Gammaproteobacteria bacterium]
MQITNPILPGFHPDPSVICVDKDYYLVTSSFEFFPGVPIFHSRDLVHWRQLGHVLTRKSQLNLDKCGYSQGVWAPTIRYHQGTFYLITTNMGRGGNFYVTAKDPAGSWSDPIWVDKHGFDPSLFFDDDGTVYYSRRNGGEIVQAEIDITTGKFKSDLKSICKGMCSPDIEGPHLYKINRWYYLMCAEGGTRFGHSETMARSKSPWGPWEKCPHNPIVTHRHLSGHEIRDTGHGELLQAHDGSWWFFCLGTRHREYDSASILGRETFMAPVSWTEDGWPIIGDKGKIPSQFEGPSLPPHPWPAESPRDDFDKTELSPCWNFLRNPHDADWSLTERPGYLRLKGSAVSLNDQDSSAFVGRRQDQFEIIAQALLEFEPQHENEEAGLTVYLTNNYHYELAITMRNGKKVAVTKKRVGDISIESECVSIASGPAIVCIQSTHKEYSFLVGSNEIDLKTVSSGIGKFLSPELAGFCWTGVYFGMYSSGNGKKCSFPADFNWFYYKANQ